MDNKTSFQEDEAELIQNKSYHFHSKGFIGQSNDKILTWDANFEKPIEFFIYPSLQSNPDDNDSIKSNKKVEPNPISLLPVAEKVKRDIHGRRKSSIIEVSQLSSSRPTIIKKITDVKSNAKFGTQNAKIMNNTLNNLQSHNIESKEIDMNLFKEKPLSWKVSVEQLERKKEIKSFAKITMEKINKSETFLRDKLRSSYSDSLVKKKSEGSSNYMMKKSNDDEDIYGMNKNTDSETLKRRNDNIPIIKSNIDNPALMRSEQTFMSGDKLYASLIKQGRSRRDRFRSISLDKGEIDMTEEELFRDQSRKLKSLRPVESGIVAENDHLFDGILYYRLKNDLETHRESHMNDINKSQEQNEASQFVTIKRKKDIIATSGRLTDLIRSQKRLSSAQTSNISAIDISKSIKSKYAFINDDESEAFNDISLNISRALNSRYIGYDSIEVLQAIDGRPNSSLKNTNLKDDSSLQRRNAKDKLIYNQLQKGIIPENLFKNGTDHGKFLSLDLSYFGLGDELGFCLGKSLLSYPALNSLGLKECRLTSISLPTIIESLNYKNLSILDLSDNNMHSQGASALSSFFYENPTNLLSLSLNKCELRCSDIDLIFGGLNAHSYDIKENLSHKLLEVNLCDNHIKSEGARVISNYLKSPGCFLTSLNLNWNELGLTGAEYLSDALAYNEARRSLTRNKLGCTLSVLLLTCNGIGDLGAQKIASSLKANHNLTKLDLSSNSVGTKACFIFSSVITGHRSMRVLDLSSNPLGEPGGRCLFRVILRRINCFIIMRSCTFAAIPNSFDISNPVAGSPYELDLQDPYQAAILSELINLYVVEDNKLSFDSVTVRERNEVGKSDVKSKAFGPEIAQSIISHNGEVVQKSNKQRWNPPPNSLVKVSCSQSKEKPSMNLVLEPESLEIFIIIIANARTEMDRKQWMQLICADAYFVTLQVDRIIEGLREKMVHISLLDIFANVWSKLLDTENKFEFMCKHLSYENRNNLVNIMSFENFKFNWINCTGHWFLDLGNIKQRNIMLSLIALNNAESLFSSGQSGRGDTSQRGNWMNFRNEIYKSANTEENIESFSFKKEFLNNLPYSGSLEFDYVCTSRPNSSSEDSKSSVTISSDDRSKLLNQLGLSKRIRLPKSKVVMAFLQLQIASCKYYFTTQDVLHILETFEEEEKTQVKVITILFSRIYDLENFHMILRDLPQKSIDEIAKCLGWLNIMNPLLPYHNFNLCLRYQDNRLLANLLLQLGATESGDNIKEDKKTELQLIEAYASLGRLLSDYNPKILSFSYRQLDEKSFAPLWNSRKDLLKCFLIGTQPISKKTVYRCIYMYKEMESDGFLTRGPIDLQYKEYLKSEKYLHKKRAQDKIASMNIN